MAILLGMWVSNSYGLSLEGTWQEDKLRTVQWNSKHLKISENYLEKMEAILGHMYISYDKGRMCQFYEPYTLDYMRSSKKIDRFTTELADYEIIGENDFGFVIEITYPNDKKSIDMIVYENVNSVYAVRLTTEDFGVPGSRVYLKKVPQNKWSYDCKS